LILEWNIFQFVYWFVLFNSSLNWFDIISSIMFLVMLSINYLIMLYDNIFIISKILILFIMYWNKNISFIYIFAHFFKIENYWMFFVGNWSNIHEKYMLTIFCFRWCIVLKRFFIHSYGKWSRKNKTFFLLLNKIFSLFMFIISSDYDIFIYDSYLWINVMKK
jgi:ABC-type siderophore export system fused ATPase/permease subunit